MLKFAPNLSEKNMYIQSKEVALNHKVIGNFDVPNPTANYAPKRAVKAIR
jgi:hypothetical protein